MLRIYHNPHCSKSRAALARLQQAGLEPEIINYLNNPPSREQLVTLIDKLDVPATELLREPLDNNSPSHDAIVDAILATPKRLQRPIVEDDTRAIIARPTERLDDFLSA